MLKIWLVENSILHKHFLNVKGVLAFRNNNLALF